jgi:hypothetical protein
LKSLLNVKMPVEIPLPGGQPARVHRGGARGVREQDTVACRASVRGEASHGPGVLLNPPPYVQVANRTIYTRDIFNLGIQGEMPFHHAR